MTKEQLKPLSKDEKAEEGREGRACGDSFALPQLTRPRAAAVDRQPARRRSLPQYNNHPPLHGVCCRASPVSSSIRICLIAEEGANDERQEEEEEEMDASAVALPLHSASRKK